MVRCAAITAAVLCSGCLFPFSGLSDRRTITTEAALWPAVVSLAFWCIVPLALALVLFRRQDLSKE